MKSFFYCNKRFYFSPPWSKCALCGADLPLSVPHFVITRPAALRPLYDMLRVMLNLNSSEATD